MAEAGRTLRADAALNQERLLRAAVRAFARDGATASLKDIATDAGVGIGTLYRRFPTRADLVWGVYGNEVDRVCAEAPHLLAQHTPVVALRTWMDSFTTVLTSNAGLADALKDALAADGHQRLETRKHLTDALAALLHAGAADGTIRAGVDPLDVHLALGGIALIAGQPGEHPLAMRLVDLLMRGLTS